jgi:hypothetical protein
MSPAKDLGTKHTCWKCETKFYDLRKAIPLCPKCGADQRESPALKAPVKEVKKAAPSKPAKIREPLLDEVQEDEDLLPEDEDGETEEGLEDEDEEEL